MGIAVANETDAVESSLNDDNFDSLDLIDRLMVAEEEPQSFSDLIESSDGLVDSASAADAGLDASPLGQLDAAALPTVDMAAFKSLPFDDMYSNGILIVSIIALVVAGLYVAGAAMKLACRITGGGRITIRRGIIATIVMSGVYALATALAGSVSLGSSPFYKLGFPVAFGTVALALLLWQNPIRALATGLIASILQTIFLFGMLAGAIILVGKFVPTKKLQRLAEHTQSFTDSLAKAVLPGDEERNRRMLSIESMAKSPSDHASASDKPKVKPIHERGLRSNPFAE